jgi:hypothetical protein
MLLQPQHQLDQIARAEAVVELVAQNVFPGVAAGAGREPGRAKTGCRTPMATSAGSDPP